MCNRGFISLILLIAIGLATAITTHAAVPLRLVALTDQQAPGFPTGIVFSEFGSPDINADGHVLFTAKFFGPAAGVTADNDDTLWSDRSGTLAFEAREGQQAVGLPMMVWYKSFATPILNDAGNLAFKAALTGLGIDLSSDEAIFSEGANGTLDAVAHEGDHAPFTPATVKYGPFPRLVFNNDGRVTWSSSLNGTGVDQTNNAAVWSGYPGSVSLIARDGNQASSLPAGAVINFGSYDIQPVIGDGNRITFLAGLSGATVTTDNNHVIYSGLVGSPLVLIRKGDPAVGAPSGVNFGSLTKPSCNASGRAAFYALLTGNVDSSNNQGIFAQNGSGALNLVARAGDAVPGTSNADFSYMRPPLICNNGSIAFYAGLTGTEVDGSNDESICTTNTGSLQVLAREGDDAPGTAEGVMFAGDPVAIQVAFTGELSMNANGQIIFVGQLGGPDVDLSNRFGIWQHDPVKGLRLIVRDGDEIEVAPGDVRVVQNTYFSSGSGGSDGKPSALNDAGEFAFRVLFTDGSEGIFVTADTDGDGTVDAFDNCVDTVNANQNDTDGDGVGDACEECDDDPNKLSPGTCGCGTSDDDSDGDGTPDCFDDCPNDANKTAVGVCGCGQADVDTDDDLILDCNDNNPTHPNPGQMDSNGDGVGDTPPEMEQCCGGGMPAMMPLMLLGWKRRRPRR